MSKFSVLCLIDTVGKGGGAEQLIAGLVPRLKQIGVEIAVAPIHDWPDNHSAEIAEAGVPVHCLGGSYAKVRPASLKALASHLRRNRYDIYWGHLLAGNAHARIAARLTGGKTVATLHSEGHSANPPQRLRDRLEVGFEGWVVEGATAKVAVSKAVAADYQHFFGWQDIAVAYNGVDVDRIARLGRLESQAATRTHWNQDPDTFLIVNAARYVTKKGQAHLIEALALLRERGEQGIHLVLCGDGDSSALQNQAEQRGVANWLTIVGVIEQAKLMPLIAAADAYVMPSLREPFGIAAAEAMALGTPAILTQVDGFLELVGDSGGALMVPPADPAALAERIMQLRQGPASAKAMASRAAARVAECFSLEACAERWMNIFAAVIEGRTIPTVET